MTDLQILAATEVLRTMVAKGFEGPAILAEDLASTAEFVADEVASAVELLLDEVAMVSDDAMAAGAWLAEVVFSAREHLRALSMQLVEVF